MTFVEIIGWLATAGAIFGVVMLCVLFSAPVLLQITEHVIAAICFGTCPASFGTRILHHYSLATVDARNRVFRVLTVAICTPCAVRVEAGTSRKLFTFRYQQGLAAVGARNANCGPVCCRVLAESHNNKIGKAVILPIAVFVVDAFVAAKASTKMLLHPMPMLVNPTKGPKRRGTQGDVPGLRNSLFHRNAFLY